jgi:hypothetical protein
MYDEVGDGILYVDESDGTRCSNEHMLDGKGRECMSEGNRRGCTLDG